MKQIIFLTTILCLASHSVSAMERWPDYFKNLVCPELDEPIDKQMLLDANPFWKHVAETESTEKKNAYLIKAIYLPNDDLIWKYCRKAIGCVLATGVNPNIAGFHRGTALTKAMNMDDYPLSKFALQCGADPTAKWLTPMIFFARNIKMAKLLIDYNTDIFRPDFTSRTILHEVIDNNISADLIPYYVKRGCDVNARDNDGLTPLMHVALGGPQYKSSHHFNGTQFRLLLKAGADVTTKNYNDKTVWDLAKRRGFGEQAQEVYDEFQQECAAYSLLVSAVRLFTNKP